MHYSLCDVLFDIAENAIESGARNVGLTFAEGEGTLEVEIRDDGPGMDDAQLARAMDPFGNDGAKHASRKVGLGIPLLLQTLEMSGGSHELATGKGRGTVWRLRFDLGHVDCPPVGDRVSLFVQLLCRHGERELVVERRRGGRRWRVARGELLGALGSLDDAQAIALARDYIESQEGDIEDGEDDA